MRVYTGSQSERTVYHEGHAGQRPQRGVWQQVCEPAESGNSHLPADKEEKTGKEMEPAVKLKV